jgi:S-DNA-T family DNA segregation ATPase FtsK/SpoIIIE
VPEGSALELSQYGDTYNAVPEPPATQQPLWDDVLAQQKAAAAASRDVLLDNAVEVVQQHDRASVSLLQRKLRIGYSRAARLIDLMEEEGIVGPPEEAGRERKVLIKGSTSSAERAWSDEDDS